MTPVALREAPPSAPPPAPRPRGRPPIPEAARGGESLAIRLATFAALAAFGAAHWTGLVADPPTERAFFTVALATAAAAALALIGKSGLRRAAVWTLSAATALATTAAALSVTGLPVRLLWPGNSSELGDYVDRGLSGIRTVDWPYAGDDEWIRLVILLGAPLLVTAAAAVTFWPARRAGPALRALGLVLLLALYGVAVTEHDPGKPLLRGFVLLVLLAAWLWLPRLHLREAAPGAALVLALGVCSLPMAAKLDGDAPWWDYRGWNWFGGGESVTFDWDHSYGPLDWPRDGTTLLNIRSDRPHYWKVETLDRFDGFRWLRSSDNDRTRPGGDLSGSLTPPTRPWRYGELNPRWNDRFRVTVRSLRSNFVVGAGTTYDVDGAGATAGSADGTFVKLVEPLERGDTYTVFAYAPTPSANQMRGAPAEFDLGLTQYTRIFLPRSGDPGVEGRPLQGDASSQDRPASVTVGLRGSPEAKDEGAERRLLASPYSSVYRLAQRLTAGQPTAYAAVRRIEDHLRRNFAYNEQVPRHDYPLRAFLFQDREGYCQQFSGAMALMLRMAGIPSRVVAGFSPGSFNRDTGEYRVRDLDAHSWVEVYFNGIGWVSFDPTPAAAPAEQSLGTNLPRAGAIEAGDVRGEQAGSDASDQRPGERAAPDSSGGGGMGLWVVPAGLLLLALGVGAAYSRRSRRMRATLPSAAVADAHLSELQSALRRLGWRLPAGTTLLALERRLGRAVGPASARYAARLRAHRYDPRAPSGPSSDERRAVRRELGAGRGPRGRLRALLAFPPGAPRVRRPFSRL